MAVRGEVCSPRRNEESDFRVRRAFYSRSEGFL
jgi:hypothetical protein